MKEQNIIKVHLEETLAGLEVTPAMQKNLINRIAREYNRYKVRGLRVSKHRKLGLVLTIALLLIAASALAWSLAPSIRTWLEQRMDTNVAPTIQEIQATPVASAEIGDITILVWEAMADEKNFLSNVEFVIRNDAKLVAYSGMKQDLPAPLDDSTVYVGVSSWYGNTDQEIFTSVQESENRVSILSEGWHRGVTDEPMTLVCTTVFVENGQPITETTTISAPVYLAETLETAVLDEPLIFPLTGFELTELHMLRTELRVYWSYTATGKNQPFEYAIRNLELRILDADGEQLPQKLSYGSTIPERLEVRIVDTDTGEVLESIQLTLENGLYTVQ